MRFWSSNLPLYIALLGALGGVRAADFHPNGPCCKGDSCDGAGCKPTFCYHLGESDPDDSLPCPHADQGRCEAAGSHCYCFSSASTVQVLDKGIVRMEDLKIGDQVLVSAGGESKSKIYEPVYAFGHIDRKETAEFLQIFTSNEIPPLEVTAKHLVYVEGQTHPLTADSIQVGDALHGQYHDFSPVAPVIVQKIGRITRNDGAFGPLTPSGTIYVDGIRTSTYGTPTCNEEQCTLLQIGKTFSISEHDGIHMWLSPFRLLCLGVAPSMCKPYASGSEPFFVSWGMKTLALAEKHNIVVQLIMVLVIMLLVALFYVVEMLLGARYAPTFMVIATMAIIALRKHHHGHPFRFRGGFKSSPRKMKII